MGCLLVAETISQEVTLVDHTNKATPAPLLDFSRVEQH
jgi:hypothetical protein